MQITNVEMVGLHSALKAAGYPMLVDYEKGAKISLDDVEQLKIAVERGRRLGTVPTGTGHDSFLKGIVVLADVNYTQYWSMQFQRYHFADIVSSQSKMHRIVQMGVSDKNTNGYVDNAVMVAVNNYITRFKAATQAGDRELAHEMFLYVISNVPMGFMLWMRVKMNYLQLKTMYQQRINGDAVKLPDDWGVFCRWCESLPLFTELCIRGK